VEISNELGVIVEFARQMGQLEFDIVSIRSEFPDAEVMLQGEQYRVEFEFKASNFDVHGHDPRKADVIICWENDLPDSVLPVVALSEPSWETTDLTLPSDAEREAAYWKARALRAEGKLEAAKQAKREPSAVSSLLSQMGREGDALAMYLTDPTLTQKEIGERLGVSQRTVGNYAQKLEEKGLIKRNRQGVEVLIELGS